MEIVFFLLRRDQVKKNQMFLQNMYLQKLILEMTTDKSYNGFIAADPLTSAFNKVNSSFSLAKVSSGDYQATLSNTL
jgi:hypothetical protein